MPALFTAEEIPQQQPQAQYSLTEQLQELAVAAKRLGLYDAEDFIARHLDKSPVPWAGYAELLQNRKNRINQS